MSLADDLVDVAKQLLPSGRGRPHRATLRRCISTAYYAAFHALSEEVATPYQGEANTPARRLLEHGAARDVLHTIAVQRTVPWLSGQPQCDQCLVQFAEDYEQLQLARHDADYNTGYSPTKEDAKTAIQRAERALAGLRQARISCDAQLQAVCIAMLASPQTRRRLGRN